MTLHVQVWQFSIFVSPVVHPGGGQETSLQVHRSFTHLQWLQPSSDSCHGGHVVQSFWEQIQLLNHPHSQVLQPSPAPRLA